MVQENQMDRISYLIIARSLFLYTLIGKGWTVKQCKRKNTFEITKNVYHKVI